MNIERGWCSSLFFYRAVKYASVFKIWGQEKNSDILYYSPTNREGYKEFKRKKQCEVCSSIDKCTHSQKHEKTVTKHIWEKYIERAEDIDYMGKQLLFRMNTDDEVLLSALIKDNFDVEFIEIPTNDNRIIKIEDLSLCSNKCFIWNKEFEYYPLLVKTENANALDTAVAPLIEYSPYRRIYSDLNTSRIYWNNNKSCSYNYLRFNNWYNKCCQIIRSNSASIIKSVRSVYCWKGYLFERDNKKVWIEKGNLLCLNVGTDCVNNCASCIRNECFQIIPSQTEELLERIILELNRMENSDVLIGGFSEPLSQENIKMMCKIISHIENKNIYIMTNGLSFAENLSNYTNKIKTIFVLNYADKPNDYVNMTMSKYGISAKRIQNKFIETANSLGMNVLVLKSSRQEALLKLCNSI